MNEQYEQKEQNDQSVKNKKNKKNRKNKIKSIRWKLRCSYIFLGFFVFFGFFLIIQIFLFMSYRAMTVKPVMFNLKKTVSTFLIQASNKKLSSSDMQNVSAQFAKVMTDTVNAYAKKNHAVLIVSDVVVAGADDVTDNIQMQIAAAMNKKK